jgi:hypothetical protein
MIDSARVGRRDNSFVPNFGCDAATVFFWVSGGPASSKHNKRSQLRFGLRLNVAAWPLSNPQDYARHRTAWRDISRQVVAGRSVARRPGGVVRVFYQLCNEVKLHKSRRTNRACPPRCFIQHVMVLPCTAGSLACSLHWFTDVLPSAGPHRHAA